MRKILFLLFSLITVTSQAQVSLAGYIQPFNNSSYPVQVDSLGKGGYMVARDTTARNNISCLRRKYGMAVYSQAQQKLYILKDSSCINNWVEFSSGGGDAYVSTSKINDTSYRSIRSNGTEDTFLFTGGGTSSGQYIDSLKKSSDSVYGRINNVFRFQYKDSASSGGKFQNDIIMNATSSNRLGYWVNGDTIPVAGLSLDSAFKIITQKAVAPIYTDPKAFISSSPTAGSREIGDTFNVSLSSTFTQNDAGGLINTVYYRASTIALASNLDTIKGLTLPVSYTVKKSYAQGACKNNNQGQQDCTGRIQAGTITSLTPVTFTPYPKRYWGVSTTFPPTSATIIDTTGGGSEFATVKAKTDFIVTVTGTDLYVYYAYPSSFGNLTSIFISGLESFNTFDKKVISVKNATGYSQEYNVYTSKNKFNNTTVTFNSVN